MTHKASRSDKVETPEFIAIGAKRIEELAGAQSELLKAFQAANLGWINRMQAESHLASDIGARLTSARSIPEVATACQEWTSRRIAMATEDAKHLVTDTQNIMATGMRMLSNGWPHDGRGGGTLGPG
jgi:hypothetical protein